MRGQVVRRATSALAGVIPLAVLPACGDAVVGSPAPVSRTSVEPTTTTSTPPKYSLARLCELLSPDEAQQLGGSAEGEKGNSIADGHTICTWSEATSLVVGFQEGTTTAQVDTGPGITNTPTTIDGLPAVQQLETDTVITCDVLVDLPSGRMLHATAAVLSAGEGKYDPCQVATQLADLIVPRVKDQ